jgi:hypothetical protein
MKRSVSALAVIPAAVLGLTVGTPTPVSSAAMDTADASIPVDAVTTLEMHTTANCVKAENNCYFTTAANLRTPDGPIGFPDDLWARQTTTLRTMTRTCSSNRISMYPTPACSNPLGPLSSPRSTSVVDPSRNTRSTETVDPWTG